MKTPIVDFVRHYAHCARARFHMPGHKGQPFLGCEALDLTEIAGADELYAPEGIILQSERNASALCGSRHSFYSTEGSSQCIRAMLRLCVLHGMHTKTRPRILAGRNAHKAFFYACALLDLDVTWLLPEEEYSLCACPVSAEGLFATLEGMESPPCALYLTTPDYLGGMLDLPALSAICHSHGIPLLVDNAHGAYLKFLTPSAHPLDLGADLCCDSTHKTLPVLTGGAYLHVSKTALFPYEENARQALSLFGSTSPSYLTLQSLDLCNRYLADDYATRLMSCVKRLDRLKASLFRRGVENYSKEPLKLSVDAAAMGGDGRDFSEILRREGVECEYADRDYCVCMAAPENSEADFIKLERALLALPMASARAKTALLPTPGPALLSIRDAMFSRTERIPAKDAVGRICASPSVSCPPAIPIAVSGEVITGETAATFLRFGIDDVDVVCNQA